MQSRRRGAALLFTLAVLAALSMFVAAFAAQTRLERRATTNALDGERAKLAAWSGVERARFELRRATLTPLYPLPWLAYHAGDAAPPPLEAAERPSFRVPLSPAPTMLVPAGRAPWPSGFVGGTYHDKQGVLGDYYVLRVEDANSRIFVNDAHPGLRRMLDTLARFVGAAGTEVGRRLIAARPAGGYQAVDDLRGILGDDDYARLAPYLTTDAWVDRKVVEQGGQLDGGDVGQATLSYRAPRLAQQARAPIDVNSAPVAVLVAALAGIGHGGSPGQPSESLSYEVALQVATAIDVARKAKVEDVGVGLQKWGELYTVLCQNTGLSPTLAAAVLANCNPNTDVNDFVPDITIWRPVDKLELTAATTELCFAPGGVFLIESLGVILGPDGVVVAEAKVAATVRAFERYVERSQADFESDREDPDCPVAAHRNLRDMTTLPEFRNASDSTAGLLAAEWDGQVTFNVITQQAVSTDGGFVGFIGRSLDGRRGSGAAMPPGPGTTVRGAVPASGTPAPGVPNSVMGGSASAPIPSTGSDLMPLGVRIGAEGRILAYPQAQAVATYKPYRQVPQSEIIMTDGHGTAVETLAVIPGWRYEPVDAGAFELWFKPAFPPSGTTAGSRQVLLTWTSDGPRAPDAPNPIGGGGTVGTGSFVSDVHADNVGHFKAAAAAGGPTEGNYPAIHVAGGGSIIVDPPPPSTFLGAPIRVGNFAYKDATDVDEHAELYAQRIDAYFARALAGVLDDLLDSIETSNGGITWGARAKLEVWLEGAGADPISPLYSVRARFEVEQKNEGFSSTSRHYARTWASDPVRPGTWHHALFSFYAVTPRDGRTPPEHTNLWVDGRRVDALGSDSWPTEIHAQARIAKRIIDSLAAGGIAIDFDLEKYRVPVEIPLGAKPVLLGARDLEGHDTFRGLLDNIIFQGNWPKAFPDAPAAAPYRFDTWRPTLGRDARPKPMGPDDHHLRFHKRTRALEWDVPLTVIGYDWTKWNELDPRNWRGDSSSGFV